MTTHVRVSGNWREVNEIRARVSGSWRRCSVAYVRVAGNWEVFFSDVSASASPSSVSGSGSAGGMNPIFSSSTTVTASGGAGSYSYSWTRISGSPSIDATSPNSATTTFFVPPGVSAGVYSATFRCTVTDSAGATATADVSVQINAV